MSSCFNGDWQARMLRWTAGMLAMLACGTAGAQSQAGAGGDPFMSAAEGRIYTGTTPLRIWHRTRGYGQEASDTAIGGRYAVDLADAIGFVDGQFRISNDSRGGGNLGGGFRWLNDNFITGNPRILGVSGWYDGQETNVRNYFNQLGVSFESLGEFMDFRMNANIPLEERKVSDQTIMTDVLNFTGNSLAQTTILPTDISLRVVDAEAAVRVFDFNAWIYSGAYQMDGRGISETGARGGVRGYLTNDLALDVGVTDDEVFGTNTVVQVIWTPGRTSSGPTSWVHRIGDRMREQVFRNSYIATQQTQEESLVAVTATDGSALRIVHVDSDAAAGGNGTAESPLNSLNDINGNSQTGDIILVHSGSTFSGQTATLKDEQRFLGEGLDALGVNQTHTVATSQLGTVTLPESSDGAFTLARPIIQNNGATDSVIVAGSLTSTNAFDPTETSNFTFQGGRHAVFSSTGGPISVNRAEMTDGNGVGINLENLRTTARLANLVWDGGTTGDGAIRIANAVTGSNVILNGTNTLREGETGTANGYAINLENSAGTTTVTGTTILNTGGDSVIINGGTASLSFTGRIDQNVNNASVVSVTNHTTGTVNFTELTANAGVIGAVTGDGIQFSNADGTYRFNDTVTLNGGDAGIDVLALSSGTFTFDDADITNPSGTALNINGSNVTAFTIAGDISTNNASGRPVAIEGNTGGSITINNAITSNGQGTLVQNNSNTTILFGGQNTINTSTNGNAATNTGVLLNNNTTGSITFNALDITTNTGNGFVATGSNTVTVANAGNTINTTTGTGLNLTNVQAGTNGIRFDTVNVNGAVNGIVMNNVTGGTVTIGATGAAVGASGTIQSTTGAGVVINNVAAVALNGLTVDGTTGDGIDIDHSGATQSVVRINNATIIDTTGNGIDYNRSASGISRFTLTGSTINDNDQNSVELNIAGTGTQDITINSSNTINNSSNDSALAINTSGGAKTVNILIDGNDFDNNDATNPTVAIIAGSSGTMNSTVTSNTFDNAGTGRSYSQTVNAGTVRLDLNGNSATNAGATNEYLLTETAGTFTVVNRATVDNNNAGTIDFVGTIDDEPSPVPQPSP